ncbi:hypothetical protein [Rubritalea tangerina]
MTCSHLSKADIFFRFFVARYHFRIKKSPAPLDDLWNLRFKI